MKKEVVILGGGFAGLAAGVELAARGHQITLFEARGRLGGRAYSFRDPATGSILDNGQHLFMGCYRATTAFLKRIGRLGDLRFQKNLTVDFSGPSERGARFRAWPLPAPWHLIGGVLGFRGWTLREKLAFFKIRGAIRGNGLDDKTVPEWLGELGQSARVRSRFWEPLSFAALNDDPRISSAALLEPVIREALLSGRRGSRIGFSQVGLSELYVEPSREFLEKNGGRVFLKTPAVKIHFSGREMKEVEFRDGRRIAPETLVLAVPFFALRKLLPDWMIYQDPFFHLLHQLKSSPIAAINLWFDRNFVDSELVGLWGTRVHWIFNKGRILRNGSGPPYLSLVISGAREEMQVKGPQLIEMALGELASVFPRMSGARLLHAQVTKEPEATLSPVVGVEKLRLPQKTPYKNLYLAGDWTSTGLPATIEGAVRSANRVVEMIENDR